MPWHSGSNGKDVSQLFLTQPHILDHFDDDRVVDEDEDDDDDDDGGILPKGLKFSIIHPALVSSQRGFQKSQCAHPFCAMKHDPSAIGNCKSWRYPIFYLSKRSSHVCNKEATKILYG